MNREFRLALVLLFATVAGCASTPKPATSAKPAIGPSSVVTVAEAPRQPVPQHALKSGAPAESKSAVRLTAYTPDRSEQHETLTLPSPVFGREVSLDDLIRFALANNPEIQVVHMQAHALEARRAAGAGVHLLTGPRRIPIIVSTFSSRRADIILRYA